MSALVGSLTQTAARCAAGTFSLLGRVAHTRSGPRGDRLKKKGRARRCRGCLRRRRCSALPRLPEAVSTKWGWGLHASRTTSLGSGLVDRLGRRWLRRGFRWSLGGCMGLIFDLGMSRSPGCCWSGVDRNIFTHNQTCFPSAPKAEGGRVPVRCGEREEESTRAKEARGKGA